MSPSARPLPSLRLAESWSLRSIARYLLGAASLVVALLAASAAQAQAPTRADIEQAYFERMAVVLATWAHPTSDVDATQVVVRADGVRVGIRYKPSERGAAPDVTVLFVPVDSFGRFGRIVVERETSFVPPFLFMTLLKRLATEIVNAQVGDGSDDRSEMLRAIQRKLRAEWDELDANDLCRYVLMYRWVDSGYWSAFLAA